jgi:hypothetical protein
LNVCPVQNATQRPSGEKRGVRARVAGISSFAAPPCVLTTYIPPCSRREKTIDSPSGEKAGSTSSAASDVSRIGSPPSIRRIQMSKLPLPARSEA